MSLTEEWDSSLTTPLHDLQGSGPGLPEGFLPQAHR